MQKNDGGFSIVEVGGGGGGGGLHGHNSDNRLNENYAAFKLFVQENHRLRM